MVFEATNLLLSPTIPIYHRVRQRESTATTRASQTERWQQPNKLDHNEYSSDMLALVSYVNLAILLAISIGHVVLSALYHDHCPTSPSLSTILMITGLSGICLSLIAMFVHHRTSTDNSNRWDLIVTYIVIVYLIGSRIATGTMAFRLAARNRDKTRCALILYWALPAVILFSFGTVIVALCLLFNLVISPRKQWTEFRSSHVPPALLT